VRRLFVSLIALVTASTLVLAACAAPAAPPTPPTQAPAAPTKATEQPKATAQLSEPTKAPAPPTAVPTPRVDYPQKGRAMTMIVPFATGGTSDIGARLLAPVMEKELGTSIEISNKPGAATQVGLTEIAKAKPDGYSFGTSSIPTNIPVYLDPRRQAAFGRKDLQPVANYSSTPQVIDVKADSPFKTLKDLVDTAKAKPDQVKVADAGIGSVTHIATLLLMKAADVKLAPVHFDSGGQTTTALLGGHVDAQTVGTPAIISQIKSGSIRVLGVFSEQRDPALPDVPTVAEQGYKAYMTAYYGILMPAGAPKEIIQTLSQATKKALDSAEVKKRLEDSGQPPTYMDTAAFETAWAKQEEAVKPLMSDIAQQ